MRSPHRPHILSELAEERARRGHCARARQLPTRTLLRAGCRAGGVVGVERPAAAGSVTPGDPAADRARIMELVSDPLGRGVVMASALVMTLLALGGSRGDDEEREAT